MKAILVDTGILYAMADRDDAWHKRATDFLTNNTDILIVPITVIPEAAYLINTYLGVEAEQKFLISIAKGELKYENLTPGDIERSIKLIESYSDANIGFVDASVVAVAERLKICRILTTDRRDFSIIRPSHCDYFTLLP
ncbi:MAG: PIN domain-containing protein [Deltaproteobacteria bacterium]|nr:PIN domain-containing protein [Deltaproteobacteria bacterium]